MKASILIFIVIVFSIILFDQSRTIDNLKSQERKCDSLVQEIYVKDIQIGRYEHIMDLIDTELDTICKEKVYEIKNKTE